MAAGRCKGRIGSAFRADIQSGRTRLSLIYAQTNRIVWPNVSPIANRLTPPRGWLRYSSSFLSRSRSGSIANWRREVTVLSSLPAFGPSVWRISPRRRRTTPLSSPRPAESGWTRSPLFPVWTKARSELPFACCPVRACIAVFFSSGNRKSRSPAYAYWYRRKAFARF